MGQTADKILLFSTIADETRVAWVDSKRDVENIQITYAGVSGSSRGNVHVGKIIRKEKALSAYFIDYIDNNNVVTQGFLPWKESHPGIKKDNFVFDDYENEDTTFQPNDQLEVGQKVLVQIVRDRRENKGAALTTFISLPGSFLVLLPNSPNTRGISRKAELNNKEETRDLITKLNFPNNMGLIIRTAGLDVSLEILQNDLNNLLDKWSNMISLASNSTDLLNVYKGADDLAKLIRDSLGVDTNEVVIDNAHYFQLISKHIKTLRPDFTGNISFYDSKVPLFTHYQVQQQLETMFLREVSLPSGGSIVIDRTEALVAIDVNSGKSTRNSSIEATAVSTNLEASKEIAKQLQLRDIGGIIVIDFIDMSNKVDRDRVESAFKQALAADSARSHIYEISKLGLLEMSRQRVKPSVGESNLIGCKSCNKRGYTRSAQSFSSSIIHILEENSVHSENHILQIQIPTNVANYLWNDKSSHILYLEKKYNIEIIIIANSNYEIPQYQLKRLKTNASSAERQDVSNANNNKDLSNTYYRKYNNKKPTVDNSEQESLFSRVWKKIFTSNNKNVSNNEQDTKKHNHEKNQKRRRSVNKHNKNHKHKNDAHKNDSNKNDAHKNDSNKNDAHKNRHNKRRRNYNNNSTKNINKKNSVDNVGVTANNQENSDQDYL